MALHFVCPGIDGQEATWHDVIVSNVTPEGKYHVQTRDGMYGMDVNDPSAVWLVDDDGNDVVPSVQVPAPSPEALQQQLLETQAALATMYEALTTIIAGGGL